MNGNSGHVCISFHFLCFFPRIMYLSCSDRWEIMPLTNTTGLNQCKDNQQILERKGEISYKYIYMYYICNTRRETTLLLTITKATRVTHHIRSQDSTPPMFEIRLQHTKPPLLTRYHIQQENSTQRDAIKYKKN